MEENMNKEEREILADLLFPNIKETPEEIEKRYPNRNRKEGEKFQIRCSNR